MAHEPELRLEIPGIEEYRALRVAAGLSAMTAEAAAVGLPASWCSVCVRHGGALVGMGRIVGDGGLFLFVVDIAVAPAWQGRGWGRRIMAALTGQLRARAPARCMVGLIADGTAYRLYEKFGFRRVAPAAHGMLLRL
ncbi:GNAT family N-acetyltransferase [Fulvimonas soli]|jgi:ribosomal protein S18 acetylase RimI-like enzyme|uniref:Acetyltransferase (GNAT) family protein n=1 Tax=Fulvimonas soli TaxID=155197 RepID=A0A316HXB7_9GAMM|nr:GNAT family N-acetyltransferase [Fulvimonas soli]PWK85357.1 acetyltransferase (GNAT) family protein [Fulvimonas soli]TNY25372.1 N-acetyltransferase [Fulvimonas soli]